MVEKFRLLDKADFYTFPPMRWRQMQKVIHYFKLREAELKEQEQEYKNYKKYEDFCKK